MVAILFVDVEEVSCLDEQVNIVYIATLYVGY